MCGIGFARAKRIDVRGCCAAGGAVPPVREVESVGDSASDANELAWRAKGGEAVRCCCCDGGVHFCLIGCDAIG